MDRRDLRKPVVEIKGAGKNMKRRHRRVRPRFIVLVSVLVLALAASITVLVLYNSRVYTRVEVEAGDMILSPEDFSKNGAPVSFDPSFSPDSVDFHTPGQYKVKLKSGIFRYTATLTVKDTVPPKATAGAGMISRGAACSPETLVTGVFDETKVSFSFETAPDTAVCGTQSLTVVLTDLGGNATRIPVTLTVIPLFSELVREAGGAAPVPADFVLPDTPVTELVTVSETGEPVETDFAALTAKPGDHPVYFLADGLFCRCILKVADTTPPALVLTDRTFGVGTRPEASLFVKEVRDAGEVRLSVEFSAPLEQAGTQTVTIRATDASGNESEGKASLTLAVDTTAPEIHGADDFFSYAGKAVSYLSGVWVTDDLDPAPDLSVESGGVDVNQAGKYTVTYVATDSAGNRSEKQVTLTLIPETVSEEAVMAAARDVLGEIIKPDMTPYDKVVAIYKWMKSHVSYRDGATIEDWQKAAYQGLTQHWGDCSVFQMTSRALLTAAGIENRLIDTVPYYNVHYWNLVNIGEGWYHFDTTSFYDGQNFCYIDSATLAARSVHYPRSHKFDPERFSFVA